MRECFNSLTNNARITPDLWWWLFLLILAAVGRVTVIYIGALLDQIYQNYAGSLLRRNLFQRILKSARCARVALFPRRDDYSLRW